MTHNGCVRDSSRDPNPEMTHLPMLKWANLGFRQRFQIME